MTVNKIFPKHFSNSYSRFLSSQNEPYSSYTKKISRLEQDLFHPFLALHYQNIYLSKERQNRIHRLIFYCLSFLFFFFAICIYLKTTNYACCLYFGQGKWIKDVVNVACLSLSILNFGIGYLAHPHKDALRYLVKKIEKELNRPVNHLQAEINLIFKSLTKKAYP